MKSLKQVRLGELLQRRRKELGYGLREMARICEMQPMTLLRIEDGTVARPTEDTLTTLSQGYGLPRQTLALAAYGEYYEETGSSTDPFVTPPSEPALA
jgi:transcriptional regulator with XRE-family HTH domain